MTEVWRRVPRARPLVAVVTSVPLLVEAVCSAVDFAEVHFFAERDGEVVRLLRWVEPDVLVVEDGVWETVAGEEGSSTEAIRSVVACALYSRRGALE